MKRALVGCVVLVACGSDGPSTTSQGDCALDIVVSGGYAWKSADTKGALLGCGSVGAKGTALDVTVYGPGDDDLREVTALFDPALVAGQVGDVNITVELAAASTAMPRAEWRSAAAACSFKIVTNEFTPDDFFENKYVIGGTVTCSGDLSPVPTNTLGAVTVNAFKFQTFENYTTP